MAAIKDYELEGRGLIPPYGPARGMLQALNMLRRTTPSRIDSDYLRVNKVAPGNEYKVVGALRFLGLIDEDGKPTDGSRLLKTKGTTYTQALQEIVRKAYSGVFHGLRSDGVNREGIYNYFVTEGGMGAEMANKATRFLIKLCRLAEIELAPELPRGGSRGKRRGKTQPQHYIKSQADPGGTDFDMQSPTQVVSAQFPMVLALTPEMASLSQEQLNELVRKMRIALEQSAPSKN